MTNKEFAVLGKALLPSLPGFALKSPLLFLPPLRHVLRALCFDRSRDKRSFYLEVFVMPLFVPEEYLVLSFGKRVRGPGGTERWSADSPDLVDTLWAAIEAQALPFLHDVQSLGDFAAFVEARKKWGNPHFPRAAAYAYVLDGKPAKALAVLNDLLPSLDHTIAWQVEMAEQIQLLKADLLVDSCRAQRRLLAWEEETVKNLKLEAFR